VNQILKRALLPLTAVALLTGVASAAQLAVGFISWDVTSSTTGEFDITNMTGGNSTGDATFPITSTVTLSSLALKVDFSNGSSETFGPSVYFSPNIFDPTSFDGGTIATGGSNPKPVDATLTGTFSPTTVTLFDGSTATISPTFTETIESSSGAGSALNDGDNAIIYATTTGGGSVPEPGFWMLLAAYLGGALLLVYRKSIWSRIKLMPKAILPAAFILSLMIAIPAQSSAAVHLNPGTSPSSGGAGQTQVNVTGSGFPAGVTAPDVVVTIAAGSCGGTVAATTTAMTVTVILGTTDRVHFLLPGSLATGTYFVSLSGAAPAFTSSNCSGVQVTHTTVATFCAPGSSLGVNAPLVGPAAVTAYVPNGAWDTGSTGLTVKQIEPSGGSPTAGLAETAVATPHVVNSCGVDPTTGKAVCTANNTDVYLLTGSTLTTTLTSGATGTAGFSGGSCMNCGLAINGVTHQAVITEGLSGSPSGTGIQFLDLTSNTFGPAIPTANEVSEDITIDPARGLIASPNEGSTYDLIQFTAADTTSEFAKFVGAGEFDSAAEDCSTGIGLAAIEFTENVYLTDFTQAVFTPGAPGTWTAPQAIVPLTTSPYAGFAAGTCGLAVAPGGSHLAVVTGEFGGNTFAVLQLPATSGSGTPALTDYAVAALPGGFSGGLDPHTMTAYTSPNNGKAYALFANGDFTPPTSLWVVDMEALLAAPRDPSNPNAVLPSYDLVAAHIVTIIPF